MPVPALGFIRAKPFVDPRWAFDIDMLFGYILFCIPSFVSSIVNFLDMFRSLNMLRLDFLQPFAWFSQKPFLARQGIN
jgi:hypothetical protein